MFIQTHISPHTSLSPLPWDFVSDPVGIQRKRARFKAQRWTMAARSHFDRKDVSGLYWGHIGIMEHRMESTV